MVLCSTDVPKTRYADPNKWIEPGESEPNDSEVLFEALLLADAHRGRAQELHIWAHRVLDDAERAEAEGPAWKPPQSWGFSNNMNKLWLPLHEVYVQKEWPAPLLEKIGLAMQGWQGRGQHDGLLPIFWRQN